MQFVYLLWLMVVVAAVILRWLQTLYDGSIIQEETLPVQFCSHSVESMRRGLFSHPARADTSSWSSPS